MIGSFGLFGVIFVALGALLLAYSERIVEEVRRYDDAVGVGSAITIDIPVTEYMASPVFVYYELTNFYQNHRRYVKSRDDDQLAAGDSVQTGSSAYSTNCDPWVYSTYNSTNMQLYPCGLVARSVFNDTFTMSLKPKDSTEVLSVNLDQSSATISWEQDVEKKFHQANPSVSTSSNLPLLEAVDMWLLKTFPPQVCLPTSPGVIPAYVPVDTVSTESGMEVVDCDFSLDPPTCNFVNNACTGDLAPAANPAGWGIDNAHFINWMRTAGLSTFRKLYARIDQSFYPGDVITVGLQSNFPVDSYEGTKSVVLSTVSWAGGKNSFLGVGYIVVGGLALVFTAVYTVLHLKHPRQLIDIDYLDWGQSH